jgi:hypothetical protein
MKENFTWLNADVITLPVFDLLLNFFGR